MTDDTEPTMEKMVQALRDWGDRGFPGARMFEGPAAYDELLLPTPNAYLGSNGGTQHPAKRRAGNHQPTLADVVEYLGKEWPDG